MQKGTGDMMSGALIETSARAILKETAARMPVMIDYDLLIQMCDSLAVDYGFCI